MNVPDITFRPITPEDVEFLYTVYASTRTEELAVVDWTGAQTAAFLRVQFNAQRQAYQETYPCRAMQKKNVRYGCRLLCGWSPPAGARASGASGTRDAAAL